MNPNDEFRRHILHWFYERNSNATSQRGKKGSSVKISDVKKGLKETHGLKQPQVVSNLNYLIDKGWINSEEVEKTVNTKRGSIPSSVTWYQISSSGIDKIEGESEFKEGGKYAGINIHATGTNVITLGDGNVVNANYSELYESLTELKTAVANSSLDDIQKLDIVTDLDSLNQQLAKPEPDRSLAKRVWSKVEAVATTGGFVEAVGKVGPLISGLLM